MLLEMVRWINVLYFHHHDNQYEIRQSTPESAIRKFI